MKEEIKNILNDLKDSAERPTVMVSNYFGEDEEEIDNDCLLYSNDCKQLLEYIENLQSQLKAKEEAEKEFIKYLEEEINKIKEQINNYNIWHEVGTDINFLILKKQFNMEILSKYKEILSKGENK